MIGEAVNELKGDGPAEKPEVRVELPVNAHIPHDYVPGERLRLEAYTRIAAIDSEADVAAVREELSDRYGPPPEPVLNLLEVARLRAARAGPGSPTSRRRVNTSGSRRWSCPIPVRSGCNGCTPRRFLLFSFLFLSFIPLHLSVFFSGFRRTGVAHLLFLVQFLFLQLGPAPPRPARPKPTIPAILVIVTAYGTTSVMSTSTVDRWDGQERLNRGHKTLPNPGRTLVRIPAAILSSLGSFTSPWTSHRDHHRARISPWRHLLEPP